MDTFLHLHRFSTDPKSDDELSS
jgi:hypothetical protein